MCPVVTASPTSLPSAAPGWPFTRSAKQRAKRLSLRNNRCLVTASPTSLPRAAPGYCVSDMITKCGAGLAIYKISKAKSEMYTGEKKADA